MFPCLPFCPSRRPCRDGLRSDVLIVTHTSPVVSLRTYDGSSQTKYEQRDGSGTSSRVAYVHETCVAPLVTSPGHPTADRTPSSSDPPETVPSFPRSDHKLGPLGPTSLSVLSRALMTFEVRFRLLGLSGTPLVVLLPVLRSVLVTLPRRHPSPGPGRCRVKGLRCLL